jgi:hypothetical protein
MEGISVTFQAGETANESLAKPRPNRQPVLQARELGEPWVSRNSV